jgi:hypothetical protein
MRQPGHVAEYGLPQKNYDVLFSVHLKLVRPGHAVLRHGAQNGLLRNHDDLL